MGYVTNRPQDGGKECCMNQGYSFTDGFKPQLHVETESRWSMMTSKIPMKVVLPFLVVIVVIISFMQFGRPHVILLLQANRSTELPVTLSPPVLVDSNGVAAGVILSLQQQSKNEPDQAKFPATNTKSTQKPTISHASSHQHIHTDAKTMDRVHICQAQNKAVFIKTHKTASTTAASIFERYGYSHNLMFALPWITHIFDENKLFNRDMVMTFRGMTTFDMITNHGRFNRKEMEAVVPHAKFVTIIRDPVGQFESAFGYFEMASNLGISKKPDPLAVFLKHPANYYKKSFHMKVQSWNGQLFDLGLNHSYCSDTSKVAKHITKLDKELDLVMLTEYFDESLILLRKLMCWSYEQILYLPKGVRNDAHRYSVSAQIAEEIREWNAADVQLYRHFNKTFWRKVNEYGPDFESDLQEFRQLQQKMLHMCIDTDKEGWGDYRETQFAHKKNAPKICDDLVRTDIEFVQLIRWKEMENEFGLAKLLGMIAGGIILIIVVMTGILVLISRVVQWFCRTGEKTGLQSNYKYAKLNQNSEVL